MMRRKLCSGFAALALVAAGSQSSIAAARCVEPAEKSAFEIRALQSQLMLAALTCGQQDEYNTFVRRHQRDLSDAYQQIASYFGRIYGSAGQQQLDSYITNLANDHSQAGISRGSSYCSTAKLFVSQALALQSADEVVRFAAENNATNPDSLAVCVSPGVSVTPDKTNDGESDTETATPELRLEAELQKIAKANEVLEQRIATLEGSSSKLRPRQRANLLHSRQKPTKLDFARMATVTR